MVITRYKTQHKLINAFNPNSQTFYLENVDKAYTDESVPTLKVVDMTFGNGTASYWLVGQLGNLSEFCGCKDKLTDSQIANLANIIASQYKHLRMSELMLFFARFKGGHYGEFYGNVDPIKITSGLRSFMNERNCALQRIHAQEGTAKAVQQFEESLRGKTALEAYKAAHQAKFV